MPRRSAAPSAIALALVLSAAGCDCGAAATRDAGCAAEELCGNGLDDTCDGRVDENCTCNPGQQRACGTSEGTCSSGTQGCTSSGQWSSCIGALGPGEEVCDGLDNDCDGDTDEGEGVCGGPTVTCPAVTELQTGAGAVLTATATTAPGSGVLSREWSVVSAPAGSTAQPSPAGTDTTGFTADVDGSYVLQYCATDVNMVRRCCEVRFVAGEKCITPPSPPVSQACGTSWDGRPIAQFPQVPADQVVQVFYDGGLLGTATGGQNHVRPAARLHPGGPPPGVPITLEVRTCRASDPTCCSANVPSTVNVVELCSAPVPPSSANVALSEYVANGEGTCPSADCATLDTCQAGEAIEITNLSSCPVSLDGYHFAYRNNVDSPASYRWMNFGAADVIPPRGVYVAIRNRQYAPACAQPLGQERTGLYGLKISALQMQGQLLCSGWFLNTGGGVSEMRVAQGAIPTGGMPSFSQGTVLTRIAPYLPGTGINPACSGLGFDAVDSCGSVAAGAMPASILIPNQLGRLWHPCDAVVNPSPACVRD